MKVSFIKFKQDTKGYSFARNLGMDVFEIDNPEDIDIEIKKLKNKKYDTIILSNELASFSKYLYGKYDNDDKVRIIITP